MKNKHIAMLGKPGTDAVSGFSGIVTSVSFDLYGCVQAVLTPKADKKGDIKDGHWFDVARIKITNGKTVLTPPDFEAGYVAEGRKGAASKTVPKI